MLPSEATLEDYLERDPSLLGERLLVVGRQVRTPHGKYIDLIAMDDEGNLHVLELKRDRTPRDVVAQTLDYGSWVSSLDRDTVIDLANEHLAEPFETAFEKVFGGPAPDELNAALQLTVVATDIDPSSERIITYLREFSVPINVVFFSYFEDDDRRYLARSWLASDEEHGAGGSTVGLRKGGKRAEWNGLDWFVSFGHDDDGRSWDDGRRYGFVSAGGGSWYSRSLRAVPVGARVNVHVPGTGYVAVGTTQGEAQRFDEAHVRVHGDWVRLASQELRGSYDNSRTEATDEDLAEYVIPVDWTVAVPLSEAFWVRGMFANQNSACKLRQEFTLQNLGEHFELAE